MSLLHEVFTRAAAENRAALIGYLPAGFPTRDDGIDAIAAMVAAGVDIVEVGLPYSDPLMDGAVIQTAVDRALKAGTTPGDVLEVVRGVAATGAPPVVMSYWNPIERYGVDRFAAPDLTPEEASPWIAATDAHAIDRVFLVAPSSTDERIATVSRATTGFVYAASTMGVTGTRTEVGSGAHELVTRTRALSTLPIAVGIGVSTADQAAEVAQYADGVIVGSAFVRILLEAPSIQAGIDGVAQLAASLAEGVRRR